MKTTHGFSPFVGALAAIRKNEQTVTGGDFALSIYKEIDEQHAVKPMELVKKSWWDRLFGR